MGHKTRKYTTSTAVSQPGKQACVRKYKTWKRRILRESSSKVDLICPAFRRPEISKHGNEWWRRPVLEEGQWLELPEQVHALCRLLPHTSRPFGDNGMQTCVGRPCKGVILHLNLFQKNFLLRITTRSKSPLLTLTALCSHLRTQDWVI